MELVTETVGGEDYEYYPLGDYIVSAPGVCGGRPTFKYTRIEAAGALNLISGGYTLRQVARRFGVPEPAVAEVVELARGLLQEWQAAA